jgi:hypothetical protein
MPGGGMVGPARLSKEEVNYRQKEQCQNCVFFYPLNSCEIVSGNISPDNVCDRWQLRLDKPGTGKDGSFFVAEFDRQQKNAALKNPIPIVIKE